MKIVKKLWKILQEMNNLQKLSIKHSNEVLRELSLGIFYKRYDKIM